MKLLHFIRPQGVCHLCQWGCYSDVGRCHFCGYNGTEESESPKLKAWKLAHYTYRGVALDHDDPMYTGKSMDLHPEWSRK